MLLYCIIRQMYILILQIINVELLAAGSYIGIIIEIALQHTVYRGHHPIAPEVELAPVDQQRIVDVFLNDIGLLLGG